MTQDVDEQQKIVDTPKAGMLCKAGIGIKCNFKRGIKPATDRNACGYYLDCIFQEPTTVIQHGQAVVDASGKVR